jgi:hypothetical protein
VVVTPCDGKFSCFFISGNASWFFVHVVSLSPLLVGEGPGGEVRVLE